MRNCVTFMALVLCFCLMLAGCGADKAKDSATTETTIPAGPQSNPDLKVEDCYTHTENKDGTYSYAVEWRGGGILYAEQNIDRPVSFMVANEDVLVIHGQAGTGVGARWAKFCDIQRGRVSSTYGSYLASVDNRVAFIENRTEAYHVFVCDPFVSNEYTQVVTLEGLVVDGDVIKDFALSEEGVLSVTYVTADGDKTVTIDMKEK
ncbi:MAG: hypothetical protein IKA50_01625 [Clostridia bacterium]|nr:hypothetical protein [Clostridia bacterium]